MNLSFHPEAERELLQAISYYEKCRLGLGIEFAEEVYQAIKRITTFPDSYAHFSNIHKDAFLTGFPWIVVFKPEDRWYDHNPCSNESPPKT